jgi:hydroxymethylbilane synthase
MAKTSEIIVAGRCDPASRKQTAELIAVLGNTNPGSTFVDLFEKDPSKLEKCRDDPSAVFGFLAKGTVDIVAVEADYMPLKLSSKLEIGSILVRGNPFNVLVSHSELILDEQPAESTIAVSDSRCLGQLRFHRSDISYVDDIEDYESLKKKLEAGEVEGFVTHASEVEALGKQDEVVEVFNSSICMPAAGQGALSLIVRSGDTKIMALVEPLNHMPSRAEVMLERKLLTALPGNLPCSVGVLSEFEGEEFEIGAVIAAPDGSEKVASSQHGWVGDEDRVIVSLVEDLLSNGGTVLIDRCRDMTEA